MISKFVILGGGTAGLISALMIKHSLKSAEVHVVESSKIGIIGVGEGSTEHWDTFMKFIGIDAQDLISNTGATYKLGIKFENWNGDGKHYWHAIGHEFGFLDETTGLYPGAYKCIADNLTPDDTIWEEMRLNVVKPPFTRVSNQYHFDTHKLNQYFHDLAAQRGVIFHDDDIQEVILDNEGFVKSLVGAKQEYTGEFFIDSSGFNRIISSKLGAKWIDCGDKLPMNSALAFPTPYQEEIPQWTNSRAMSSGWMWRIPTQSRFGNGYVFCDQFINEDQAYEEIQSQFDHEIEIGKKVKFSAGYVNEFWIKNCLSVGLAGMFVEPLEASSIGSTIQQIFGFINSIHTWDKSNVSSIKRYNKDFREVAENIVDFIQLHYITKRNDSEFWRWVKEGIVLTDFNKENLPLWKNNIPCHSIFNDHYKMFKNVNFIQVLHGLEYFNSEVFKEKYYKHYPHFDQIIKNLEEEGRLHDFKQVVSHREAINSIIKGYKTDYITVGDLGIVR
jgi:tryptophan halogenase